jgi:hypothetical protein
MAATIQAIAPSDGRRAEQISGAPPIQRGDAFLLAEKQQHAAKHRGHHRGNEIERRNIK